MPTIGIKSKELVQEYINEIYELAKKISPSDINGNGDKPFHNDIWRMAHLALAITQDFNAACFEYRQLELKLKHHE